MYGNAERLCAIQTYAQAMAQALALALADQLADHYMGVAGASFHGVRQ